MKINNCAEQSHLSLGCLKQGSKGCRVKLVYTLNFVITLESFMSVKFKSYRIYNCRHWDVSRVNSNLLRTSKSVTAEVCQPHINSQQKADKLKVFNKTRVSLSDMLSTRSFPAKTDKSCKKI